MKRVPALTPVLDAADPGGDYSITGFYSLEVNKKRNQ